MHIKPATVPEGWRDDAVVINKAKRWYKHTYVETATGKRQDTAPPGTRSFCEMLLESKQTAVYVGKPTHFLSHAWLYKFLNLIDALTAFVAAQPEGNPEWFFWFDVSTRRNPYHTRISRDISDRLLVITDILDR